MNITRQANYIDGKWVYDPPLSAEEIEADRERFRDLCQSHQAPGTLGSDRAFMEGHHAHGFTEEPEWMREMILAKAKKAGVITQGKKYVSGLSDDRGPEDQRAWVSDISEMKSVLEDRNLHAKGIVNRTAREVEPEPPVPLSKKHIRSIDRDYQLQDPNWKRKRKEERAEAIIEKHGAPAARRKRGRVVS